ncbi:OB-fold nucleic acid binding domain-containing protein [Ottowia beijingensis]|uniref:helix-hairpin-helix domain-containing protein n=1 Tax=Ottowia beijingensis TaxID=1207057 RepID=UPI003A5238EC
MAIARDLHSWGDLCSFITACRRAAPKGHHALPPLAQALAALRRCALLWAPAKEGSTAIDSIAACALQTSVSGQFDSKITLLAELHGGADDALWLAQLRALSAATGWPLAAAGDVHMHVRARKRLHDVMTAIRVGQPVHACGFALQANAERHLRPRERLAAVYPPDLLAATLAVAARCAFGLDEIQYNYPEEAVIEGLTPTETLAQLTREGAAWRFPKGVPPRIQGFIDKELALIEECRYEMFFLTVHDIVRWARGQGILCQGRGSAANSVVCYCLGITAADPEKSNPLLERFISKARQNEPPDIDVDFEHERREQVIQYIYRKYGRSRAALSATVICYRRRSALRDVGRALGVDERLIDAFAKDHHWFDDGLAAHRLGDLAATVGAAITPALASLWLQLTEQLRGAPRHLSQHVGGFVLTETPLHRLVPLENAAMEGDPVQWDDPDAEGEAPASAHAICPELERWLPPRPALRQVIQWDKDDLDALGLMKVDVLALGMLTAMRRCLEMVSRRRGRPFTRSDIQSECPETYRMIRRADTVGTFQIESRAQMSMLPRLKPTTFYDLVVQVAIVRPGPISGGMVHPYLKARERRRRGLPITYDRSTNDPAPNPADPDDPECQPRLAKALRRTLGIPIFQEQVMEVAMIAADYSAEDADRLRRDMAAWKRKGGLGPHRERLIQGMRRNGYEQEYAERIFRQIEGFGEYGFPESHAYSFALIAYESSWLKCHEPEAFLAAMLNSQPMGFYGPAQLVQDARRHGVVVLPPDVTVSGWDCALEEAVLALSPAGAGPGWGSAPWPMAAPSAPHPSPLPRGAREQAHPLRHGRLSPPLPLAGEGWGEGQAVEDAQPFFESNLPRDLTQKAQHAIENEAYFSPSPAGGGPGWGPPRATRQSAGTHPSLTPARETARPAVRLGLRLAQGLNEAAARRIEQARAERPFTSVDDLARRAQLDVKALNQLAAADALITLAGHRRQQVWQGAALKSPPELLRDAPIDEAPLALPPAPEGEEIVHDYAALGLTLRRHPLALLRPRLARWRLRSAQELKAARHGEQVRACGIVIGRQQPGTAKGTIFVTLEDETGSVNVIVWKSVRVAEDQRNALLRSRLLAVQGEWQIGQDSGGHVRHLIAQRFVDLTPLLGRIAGLTTSRDFH